MGPRFLLEGKVDSARDPKTAGLPNTYDRTDQGDTMKILRLSTRSLALAIAVFTLGYVNPASADKPGMGGHNHGGGGGGGTATTYSVVVVAGTGSGKWVVTPDGCEGQTPDSPKLNVRFPEGCPTGHVTVGGVLLFLYAIEVRDKKSDATLYFSDIPVAYSILGESVYNSARLSADIVEVGESSLEIRVNLTDLQLIKGHQPSKNSTLGPIAVGNIVYTANP